MDWDRIRRDFGWGHEEPPRCRIPTQPAILNTRIPQSQHRPADNASPSLSILGLEVLSIIMDIVQQESPASLSSIALVNSTYYHLARYSQFRDLSFDIGTTRNDLDKTEQLRSFSAYLENAGLLSSVRELRIYGQSPRASEGELTQIATLIPNLTGLADLVWHSPQSIPDTILEHLHKRPSLRLHTRALHIAPYGVVKPDDAGHGFLSKLKNCKNLYSLEVAQTFSNPVQSLAVTKPLRQILLSCPNLRRLKIDIGMPTGGCVIMGPPREYCGLGLLQGERPLAALEELDLVRYPFGMPPPVEDPDSKSMTFPGYEFYSDGYPLRVREEDYWARNFDWSHMKRLVAPSKLGIKLMPYLTSLREMSMQHHGPRELKEFYKQVPAALQTITVSKLGDVGLKPILRHGSTLRKLQIHQHETRDWAKQAVSLGHLRSIRKNCPCIEELEVDLARSGTWPYEAFDILASFPKLRRLALWFELGLKDFKNPIQPYTTFHASQEIGRYLFAKSPRSPPCLETIQINSGSPPPLGFGYPAPEAFWPGNNSTSFICRLSDRDDEAINGVFTTKCTKIGKAGNHFLNTTQPGWADEEFEQALTNFNNSTEALSGFKQSRLESYDVSQDIRSIRLAHCGPTPISRASKWDGDL